MPLVTFTPASLPFSFIRKNFSVNVASRCGYTDSNYKQLQTLYEKYQKDGLQIFAMPTNEFGGQEPGSDADIIKFTKDKYAVTFPVFSKLKVNGGDASEIYRWLKSETKDPPAETNKDIRWNFTKVRLLHHFCCACV